MLPPNLDVKTGVTVTLDLPYPPSINHYWRRVGARTILSRKGREYRARVLAQLGMATEPALRGPLAVEIKVSAPDRRRRDLDNVLKALLDAMQHANVYVDDSQVVWLLVEKHPPRDGGSVQVTITELQKW